MTISQDAGIYVPEDYWFLAQDMKEVVVVHPRAQAKSLDAPLMLSEVALQKLSKSPSSLYI